MLFVPYNSKMPYNSNFSNKYSKEIGGLDVDAPHRAAGKKVFDWSFRTVGVKATPVVVHLINDRENEGLTFVATCASLKKRWSNPNIAELSSMVEQDLNANIEKISGIAWEDWFEVIVTGGNSDFNDSKYSALGGNLKIQVNVLKRGVDPLSGKVLSILDGYAVDFPVSKDSVDKFSKSFAGEFGGGMLLEKGSMCSYIPATPANRASLDDILSRMSMLRERLKSLLSQDTIETGLTSILKLLPAPTAEQASEK